MKKAFLLLSFIVGISFLAWKFMGKNSLFLTPPEILGGVVRVDDEKGSRLYYLTGQWEKRIIRIGSSRNSSSKTLSWYNVDLWEIDGATAQPLHRRRIKRDKVNSDMKALGMDQGILWARIPELAGIRLTDGQIVADKARIEAKNPSLATLIPKPPQSAFFLTESQQPLKFDPGSGMTVRLDDARIVRIDPITLEATPHVPHTSGNNSPAPADPATPPTRSKVISPANGMDWYAMVRSLNIAKTGSPGNWLGLLSEDERAKLNERNAGVSHQMDHTSPRRHRLYRASLTKIEDYMSSRFEYQNLEPLPEAPGFLMAGLLIQAPVETGQPSAMWRRDPDSVFVISRDRLGDDGRMQLARISGPKGVPVWNIALPVSNLSAWIPGEKQAFILGPDPTAKRSPMAEENENTAHQILSVDLATGKLGVFNPDFHRDWPVTETPDQKSP